MKNYNKKKIIVLFFFIGVAIFLFLHFSLLNIILGREVRFSGTVTDTNNECWADGTCSIKVNNQWIIVADGGLTPPNYIPPARGRLIGISFNSDTNKYIGKKAEVYALREDGHLTIYGNKKYYVKLFE